MWKIGWPCWIATTRRLVKLPPSRLRSTSYTIGALKSPRRRKYACSECTARSASTVRLAAISAWPSTCPPKTCGLPMSRLSPRNRFISSRSRSSRRSRSARTWFMRASFADAEPLLHDRAGRRVLQVHLLRRVEVLRDRERRERRLVEAAQDQLFLARVGVDVADRKDARHAGLEPGRV